MVSRRRLTAAGLPDLDPVAFRPDPGPVRAAGPDRRAAAGTPDYGRKLDDSKSGIPGRDSDSSQWLGSESDSESMIRGIDGDPASGPCRSPE
jgi:hypothetical protein